MTANTDPELVSLCARISSALSNATVIQSPPGNENGYWAGAPGGYFEAQEKAWYLTYRLRRPRGVHPDRGGEARIAHSEDLVTWRDQWSLTKDRLNSASMERCALRKGPDGRWRFFLSYVDPEDGRWCVSSLVAEELREFDPAKAKPIFKAAALKLEGIKDPWIFEGDGVFQMILSVALPISQTSADSHSTMDIFNTGQCVSATGLALSRDLDRWDWQGIIFQPGEKGWDSYCRRINSILSIGDKRIAFYDGSSGHHQNYEERTGLALQNRAGKWGVITPDGPAFTSPNSTGSLRYLDMQVIPSTGAEKSAAIFFEYARADGAHDLRLATMPV